MQDNLEFLQWSKRYWDQYFPGLDYDPVARRKGAGTSLAAGPSAPRVGGSTGARRPAANAPSSAGARLAPRTGSAAGGGGNAALIAQNKELQESVAGLERERDFYFNKLREIEVLLQTEVEAKPELETEADGVVPKVQAILYSTEEGFEIPDVEGEEGEMLQGEEETF